MIEIRSFRDLARLFFIYRREFKWAFAATVLVAVLGAFLLPARYESEARLLVKPGRDTSTLPIEYADRQTLVAPSTQRDPIVDEEKLLTGRPIIHQVAEYYLSEMRAAAAGRLANPKIPFEAGGVRGAGLGARRAGAAWAGGGAVPGGTAGGQAGETVQRQPPERLGGDGNRLQLGRPGGGAASAGQMAGAVHRRAQPRAGPQEPVSVLRRGKRQAGRADRRLQGADRPATAPDRRHQLQERLDSLTDQLNKLEAARSADQAEWMAVQGGIANAQASGGKLPREITRSAS